MPSPQAADALRRLGLTEAQVRLYQALLDHGPARPETLRNAAELTEEEYAEAYDGLFDLGMAGRPVGGELLAPLPPGTGLEILQRHLSAELEESRLSVGRAFDAFRRERLSVQREDLVEVVHGADVGERLRGGWRSARTTIRQLDSPPYFTLDDGVDQALETLGRGVEQRVIYSQASLAYPGKLEGDISRCLEAGEQGRVVPSVPVKLILIDEALGMVSSATGQADEHSTLLVVQPSDLLTALISLFEYTWDRALPFHDQGAGESRPMREERLLLSLLASGVSDDVVARELGISRRTLYRRIEVLMARLGASNRFQLALQAQRRNWI